MEAARAFEWLRAESEKPGAPIQATHALLAWKAETDEVNRLRAAAAQPPGEAR